MLSRIGKVGLLVLCILSCILFTKPIAVKALYATVSNIDRTTSKQMMMVDGQPFFYAGEQISPHRLMDNYGWTWPDMEKLFQQAKNDGFTVIASPVKWNWIEPTKDQFNWSNLDPAIDYSAKYGMKMEILWFGSETSTKSSEGSPSYVMSSYQPVLKSDGTPIINNGDGKIKLDMTDPNLLSREKYVMTTMMNHVRSYITAKGYGNVVVGVQVQNEPTVVTIENNTMPTDRSYSTYANTKWQNGGYTSTTTFNTDVQYDYVNGLSQAVKTSDYSVWTRCNWAYEANIGKGVIQKAQNNGVNNYFDFGGNDPYSTSLDTIYNIANDSTGWHYGNNLAMIMENAGNYSNTDQLMFNAFAGDGVYHIFELNDSWNVGPQGLYSTDFTAKTIAAKSHVPNVRSMIAALKQDWKDLATKKASLGGTNVVFYNRNFTSFNQAATVGGRSITFNAPNGGGGIAIARDSSTYVYIATWGASFTIPSGITVSSLQKGYYDQNDNWVNQGSVSYSNGSFNIAAWQCIRLVYSGGDSNLALGKTASMNTTAYTGHPASNAIDGNTSTYAQSNSNTPWDLNVDLLGAYTTSKVVFTPDSANYATQYSIQISTDNMNWTKVATETNGTGTSKAYTFNLASARYVLVNVTAVHGGGTTWGHAVREFEIWGH